MTSFIDAYDFIFIGAGLYHFREIA